jgi:hypothetical protein
MITPITLYLDGKRTSYEPPSEMYVKALGEEKRQEKIANAVNLVARRLYPEHYSAFMSLGEQLETLAEVCDTTQSGVINFSLAYAMAHGEMYSTLTDAVEMTGQFGRQALDDATTTIAEKSAAVGMASQIQYRLERMRSEII